jgi:hypothetical protein
MRLLVRLLKRIFPGVVADLATAKLTPLDWACFALGLVLLAVPVIQLVNDFYYWLGILPPVDPNIPWE